MAHPESQDAWLELAVTALIAWRGGTACRDGALDRCVASAMMRAHNDAVLAAAEKCREMSERLMEISADCEEPDMNTYAAEAQALAEAQAKIMKLGVQEF